VLRVSERLTGAVHLALVEIGYEGNVDIEHEDEGLRESGARQNRGESDIVAMLGRERKPVLATIISPAMPPYEGSDLLPHYSWGGHPTASSRHRQVVPVN